MKRTLRRASATMQALPSPDGGRNVENGHDDSHRHIANDAGDGDDQDWLQRVGKGRYVAVHVLLVSAPDVPERPGQVAGLFADREHVGHHAGESP